MTQAARGVFITLEGVEGAGKSTAARNLGAILQAEGHEVLLTREPGGTEGAEAIRALLLNQDVALHPLAQTLLHYAARVDHVEAVIRPALARGVIVICDRFYDSTMAYQAYGQGVDVAAVAGLTRLVGLVPDVTFILQIPDFVANDRLVARGGGTDRYEAMPPDFMARIAAGFLAIATAEPDRCVLIDADMPAEALAGELRRIIKERGAR